MKRFKSIVLAAFAVLVGVVAYVPLVSADSASLSIAPKKNYVIEPGKSVDDKLVIRNLDRTQTLNLSLRVVDFTFTDDSGTPKLFLAEDAPQTTWSLKPFVTVPENVSIPPSGSKTIDMSVAIPAGHGAGSYYSAIVYSSTAGQGSNVGLSASGVTLVFTQIPGKVNEDLQLKKFGAYDPATKNYMFITTKKPQTLGFTLKNNGNVVESPAGSITLKHMFIGKEQTIGNLNPSGSLAIIGQTRTFSSCIKMKETDENAVEQKSNNTPGCDSPMLWPGMYTAKLDLFYGQNGNLTQEITKTVTFWYLPLWFLIPFVILLLVAAYYIRKFVRAVRGTTTNRSGRKMPTRRR